MTHRTAKELRTLLVSIFSSGKLLSWVFVLSACVCGCLLPANVWYGYLSPDDFQHTHLAWLTLHGKLIYRDFFDNHGPLSAWWYGRFLGMRGTSAATFESILFLRAVNAAALLLQVVPIWGITRRISDTGGTAWAAVALFLSSAIVHFSGTPVRPDSMQNLLALSATWLLLARRPILAGFLLGTALGFHSKSILFVAPVLFAAPMLSPAPQSVRPKVPERVKFAGLVLTGLVVVPFSLVLYFWLSGSFEAFAHGYAGYNGLETWSRISEGRPIADLVWQHRWNLIMADAPFLSAALLGLVLWVSARFAAQRDARFVFAVSVSGLAIWLLPLYTQVTLASVPMLAIAAACGFTQRSSGRSAALSWVLVAVVTAQLSARIRGMPTAGAAAKIHSAFRAELDQVLVGAGRETPVLFIWPTRSPAYVFNANVDRLWMMPPSGTGGPRDSLVDESHLEAFRRVVRDKLATDRLDWVVVDQANFEAMEAEPKGILEQQFDRHGSVWHRRTDPSAKH